jgi:multimeric flavodoxin WrbA
MKICVLNGSPKHEDSSLSMHYIKYLAKRFSQADFDIINIGCRINQIEKEDNVFDEICQKIKSADAIIWGFPLYYLLVASQYKRWIELIFEKNCESVFHGKPAASIATSIHFCDNFALNYIRSVSEDLEMNYFDSYSAHMDDFNHDTERERLSIFMNNFIQFIQSGKPNPRRSLPVDYSIPQFHLEKESEHLLNTSKNILILSDESEKDHNLKEMTSYLHSLFANKVQRVHLDDFQMSGGCLGCIKCGYDFTCVYDQKDLYRKIFEEKVQTADIIIFAGSIHDRYLSSKWKKFFDRSFFHNHSSLISGKQVGMLISGPLRQLSSLQELFMTYFEANGAHLVGIVSDDRDHRETVKTHIQHLADKLVRCSEQDYLAPTTFLGLSGKKIFRDEIHSKLRFPFIADYKHYKQSGRFDFPQKDKKIILINNVLKCLTIFPKIRKELFNKGMDIGLYQPFRKLIAKTEAFNEQK